MDIDKPLALMMAPKSLTDIIGQEHLLGKDKIITNLIKNKKLFSMILYGKPGIGKTSLALAMVQDLQIRYRFLNAVINQKKDFDIVIEEAKMYGNICLIVDEIHRLNKDKQDLLLPQLENGRITLIGMTTANPYHRINPAIRSRCHLFELHELTTENILTGLNKAIKHPMLNGIKVTNQVLKYIAQLSGNDLRYAYNMLELAYFGKDDHNLTMEYIKSITNKPIFFHDKNESGYYDVLSAFQKSIRGSDVQASLHYLGRLIEAGDLESIYRRMSVIAYEDIGLANPSIGPKVMAAIEASELVGLPEARIPLATIVCEMALSPKSNTAITAIDKVLDDIHSGNCGNVPAHLKNPSNEYKYPHNYPNSYVVQQYLPDNIKHKKYYEPKSSGYEASLKEVYLKIEQLKKGT